MVLIEAVGKVGSARARRSLVVLRPATLALALASAFSASAPWAQNAPGAAATLAASVVLKGTGLALPSGGVATWGQASFDTSRPNSMWVSTQNGAGTQHSVINWQSFSIGAGSTVYFQQPGATSTSINRVVTNTPTELLGSLGSNGKLVLVNPSGITVGAGAAVDTAGFTASTLAMSDADAASARLRFGDPAASASMGGAAGITVLGRLVARQGDLVLVAPQIDTGASALLQAPNGAVVLAAGQQVEISGRGLEGIVMQVQAPSDRALNLGSLQGDAVAIFAGTLTHSGLIQATSASLEGGKVVLKATGGTLIQTGAIDASGSVGGSVQLSADNILSSASIKADGQSAGGQISLQATQRALATTSAQYSAHGGTGQGGDILVSAALSNYSSGGYSATGATGGSVTFAGDEIKLASSQMDASGTMGGGAIHVGGLMHGAAGFGAQGTALANATSVLANSASSFKADAGQNGNGGEVVLWSDQSLRFGGSISAQGGALGGNGGSAEVSGKSALGYHGVTHLSAAHGAAGTLLLDPNNITIVAGNGAQGAAPYLEILDPTPGAGEGFGGSQNTMLPNGNIAVVSAMDSFAALNAGAVYLYTPAGALVSALTGSSAGDHMGQSGLHLLSSGNFLVDSSSWSNAQAANAGAVTWMNGATGALSDGSVGGAVSPSNSLVGSTAGDALRVLEVSGNVALASSANWFNSATGAANAGAITWINGANGHLSDGSSGGAVSSSNSLVGSAAGDFVGRIGDVSWGLSGGNLAISSQYWGSGGVAANALGALTWMNGATGKLSDGTSGGQVSGANSLVGALPGDRVGTMTLAYVYDYATNYPYFYSSDNRGLTVLNGNVFVGSNNWSNGANAPGAGAVTWMNGATGALADGSRGGVVSSANSLVGSAAGDKVGTVTTFPWGPQTTVEASGLTDLGNGNFVVRSGQWGSAGGANSGLGAVTWGSGTAGVTGVVSSANSLVGSLQGDRVGAGWINASMNDPGVVVLQNGNYAVVSSDWGGGKGAVTLGNGLVGTSGLVSAIATAGMAPSLVGAAAGDHVGSQGLGRTVSDNFIVKSPQFNAGAGAATFMNGSTGALSNGSLGGVVDASNSLLGGSAGDAVGANVMSLNSANFLALTPNWNGARGAVTWLDGSSGKLSNGATGGVISDGSLASANSLVGSTPYDMAGLPNQGGPLQAVTQLGNGNLMVSTPQWNNPSAVWYWDALGAVTWMNGATGKLSDGSSGGAIGVANSLVGAKTGDQVGLGYRGVGVTPLNNHNVVITSQWWNNGAATWAGAATWMDGSSGKLVGGATGGTISNANSLVGTHVSDLAGDQILPMANGNYVVASSLWGDGQSSQVGAVTWGNGVTGTVGDISSANSLVGAYANDLVSHSVWPNQGVEFIGNNYLVRSDWNGGMGSVTWVNGANGKLVTGSVGDVVSASNSLVGSVPGDNVGRSTLTRLSNGAVVLGNQTWNGGAGAVTWMDAGNGTLSGGAPVAGVVSAANSLVGSVSDSAAVGGTGDRISSNGVTEITDGSSFSNYLVASPNWVNGAAQGAGAVTFANGATGRVGVVSASNSLVGTLAGDHVGSGSVYSATDHTSFWNAVVHSPDWGGAGLASAGAVTWLNGQSGALSDGSFAGAVGTANSLVGSNAGDQVGVTSNYPMAGVTVLGNGNLLLRSQNWNGGFSALTWMSGATGKLSDGASGGAVSAGNSLLGSAMGDNLGANDFGVTELTNGNWVIATPWWTGTGATQAGAVTWMNGATGHLADGTSGGVLSSANSLIGGNSYDNVGSGYCSEGCSTRGAIALSDGNYVVNSPYWANGSGAVTWGDGANGTAGTVSLTNSAPVRDYNVAESGSSGKVLVGSGSAHGGAGGVYVLGGATAPVSGWLFADSPGADASIGADSITATLNSGSNVVLQANSDLMQNVGAAIVSSGAGNLTLQAGRSVVLNDAIKLVGTLTVTANDPGAISANRTTGAPTLDTRQANLSALEITLTNSGGDILTGALTATGGMIQVDAANALQVGGAMSSSGNNAIQLTATSVTVGPGQNVAAGGMVGLTTDSLALDGSVSAAGGLGFLSFHTKTPGRAVQISNVDDTTKLSLTPAEMSHLLAGYFQLYWDTVDFQSAVSLDTTTLQLVGSKTQINAPLTLTKPASVVYFDTTKVDINAPLSVGSGGVHLGRNTGSGGGVPVYQVGVSGTKPNAANALELSNTELRQITTTGPVYIGDMFNAGSAALNPVQFVGPIDLSGVTTQLFVAGRTVTQSPGATIKVGQLDVTANGAISLPEANQVALFAAHNYAPASDVLLASAGNLTLGTVPGGTPGVSATGKLTVNAAGSLSAGGVTADQIELHGAGLSVNGALSASGAGDALVLDAGAASFANSAGAGALAASNGRWLVYSGDPANDTRAGLVVDFKQYNTAFGGAIAGSGNGLVYRVVPPAIVPTLTSAVVKTYDTSTSANTVTSLSASVAGIDGDSVAYSLTLGAANYDTANAGSAKKVSANVLSSSAVGTSSTGKPVYGYSVGVASVSGLVGRVDPADISAVAGISAANKVADGTTLAALNTSGATFAGKFAGDTLNVASAAGAFADAAPGTGKTVNISAITLGGASAGNYLLLNANASTTADILAAPAPAPAPLATVWNFVDAFPRQFAALGRSRGLLLALDDSPGGGGFAADALVVEAAVCRR